MPAKALPPVKDEQPSPYQPPQAVAVRSEHHNKVYAAWRLILATWPNIRSENATPIAEGGFIAPLLDKDVKALTSHRLTGGINGAWLDPLFSITPGVSIKASKIASLRKTFWPEGKPKQLSHPFTLKWQGKVAPNKLALERLSPDEPLHALILQVGDRLSVLLEEPDQNELDCWKLVLTSCTGTYVICDNSDEQYFELTNHRLAASAFGDALKHTPLQKVEDILCFKNRKEKESNSTLTAKYIAGLYLKFLKQNDGESRASESTIAAALVVGEKVLKHPQLKTAFEHLEDTWSASWNIIWASTLFFNNTVNFAYSVCMCVSILTALKHIIGMSHRNSTP